MFAGKEVKLGIAPIAWTNDDLPELGGAALAGFCRVLSSSINEIRNPSPAF